MTTRFLKVWLAAFALVVVMGSAASAEWIQLGHFGFERVGGSNNSTVAVPQSINPMIGTGSLASGDEIGVFTPEGLCVGAAAWPPPQGNTSLSIAVWGDNDQTPAVDGIRDGERMYYRVWDQSAATEYQDVTVAYDPNQSGGASGIFHPQKWYALTSLVAELPMILVTPASLAFGDVGVGNSGNRSFTVTNLGGGPLKVTGITITPSSGPFTISTSSQTSFSLPKNGSRIVTVIFTPTTTGSANADISIVHNAGGSPSLLTAAGNGTLIVPLISVPTGIVNLGSVRKGSSLTGGFMVKNPGTGTLSVTGITSTNLQFTPSPTVFYVAPGDSQFISITFVPVEVGPQLSAISITHNDGGPNPATVTVAATGVNNPPLAVGQTIQALEDSAVIITLGATDPDADPLMAVITAKPVHGKLYQVLSGEARGTEIVSVGTPVSDAARRVIYLSAPDSSGMGHGNFRYEVYDRYDSSSDTLITVNVAAVNDLPVINQAIWDWDGNGVIASADSNNLTLDSGGYLKRNGDIGGDASTSVDNIDIRWSVSDPDDLARLAIYRSTDSTLTASDVISESVAPDSLVVRGLNNATAIVDTLTANSPGLKNLKIVQGKTPLVAAGDYFIYFVAWDGKGITLDKISTSQGTALKLSIRHSPGLEPVNLDATPINTGKIRYVTVSWALGQNDWDIDDNASISLYYSQSPIAMPISFESFRASPVHLFASGIKEDVDDREDNQYCWDLWNYRDEAGNTVPSGKVYIYGVIEDPQTKRVVRWGNDVTFNHTPFVQAMTPSNTDLVVSEGGSARISWLDGYLGGNAYILVALVDASNPVHGVIADFASGIASKDSVWIVNSAQGGGSTFTSPGVEIREDDGANEFELFPDNARYIYTTDGGSHTMGDGFYYVYVMIDDDNTWGTGTVISRAPSKIQIVGSNRLTAPTPPLSPTEFTTGLGDTTILSVRPNSNGASVDLASVFITIDANRFSVVDQDAATAGIQPFKLNTAGGFTQQLALTNSIENIGALDLDKGLWLLNFVYYDYSGFGSLLDGSRSLATIEVSCLGIDDGVVMSSITLDDADDRRTALFNKGRKIMQLYQTTTATVVPRARLAGVVPLEGRSSFAKQVTLDLRATGQSKSITDSYFLAANDEDPSKSGAQVTLTQNGAFSLSQIPPGIFDLVVRTDGYLAGQYSGLVTYYGATLGGINPTRDKDGVDRGLLYGGDAAGYTDPTGRNLPDNEVDISDRSAIVSAFDSKGGSARWNAYADIDGDGHVFLNDLNMAAANDSKKGVPPVYKPATSVRGNDLAAFEISGLPLESTVGDRVLVPVRLRDGADVRAYAFRLRYDPSQLRLVKATEGDLLSGYETAFVNTGNGGDLAVASAIVGRLPGVSREGTAAVLEFEVLRDGHVELTPVEAMVIDITGHQTTAQMAAPAYEVDSYSLLQNSPNPFNPSTAIRYELPQTSEVRLVVVNVLGEQVKVLAQGRQNAGRYSIQWDGRDTAGRPVASGIYFARMAAGRFAAVQKMVLLK